MGKKKYIIIILCICMALTLSSCGKKQDAVGDTTQASTSSQTQEPEKVITAEDIIETAENSHFYSTDVTDEELYAEIDTPYTDNNLYIQKHLLSEFPSYTKDKYYFSPAGEDYLIGCFDGRRTFIYTYDSAGDVYDIKGRMVYDTKDELLSENKDKNLIEDKYTEKGYIYHDNVLYYTMSDEDIYYMEASVYKYDLLKIAASGAWDKDGYLFYFSMPYKDGLGEFNYGIKEMKAYSKSLSEDDVYYLFTNIMSNYKYTREEYAGFFSDDVSEEMIDSCYNTTYRLPSEFEKHSVVIAACENGLAYATLELYTVPDNSPNEKIDNYMFATLIEYNDILDEWQIADTASRWGEIEDLYYRSILTPDCYNEACNGNLFRRFWIQFNLNDPFYFEDVMTARVMEIYTANDGMYVTLYFYNDTDEEKYISSLDSLVINCDRGELTSVSANLNLWLSAHDYIYDTLYIPWDYLSYSRFSEVSLAAFEYH